MDTQEKSYTREVNAGRIAIMREIAEIQEWQNKNDDKDLQDNENYREPLCVDTQLVKKIVLSTGGPEDGFELYFDVVKRDKLVFANGKGAYDYELSHGVYYRKDWGEYTQSTLTDEQAQTVFDFYLGGYIEEA